ncbi:hypothetical protein DICPUDRAFT_148824 [Dictyostelium purpureum]|uniref:EGF-like domain-containing protein n=1 Tax=Dictyostelium purpureum TaxID=5786 RepID=F0ZC40_DICPU|nr:uncharacterized protein DICPUDRAFT_148824 [Dictyostelium purpureum]EGC38508.1 hypothetical protein DICPUDRAFT_148824 [Dictyostelium purpureum]|eukprot:XP_003284973.1 hypothetical protein DICPUDRAFT_148824 [Dictyostelium purpureum]
MAYSTFSQSSQCIFNNVYTLINVPSPTFQIDIADQNKVKCTSNGDGSFSANFTLEPSNSQYHFTIGFINETAILKFSFFFMCQTFKFSPSLNPNAFQSLDIQLMQSGYPFLEYSTLWTPVALLKSNISYDQAYILYRCDEFVTFYAKVIGQNIIEGVSYYYYIVPFVNTFIRGQYTYFIWYYNGPFLKNIIFNNNDYKELQVDTPQNGYLTIQDEEYMRLSFLISRKDAYATTYSFYSDKMISTFPYGFFSYSGDSIIYSNLFHSRLSDSITKFKLYSYPGGFEKAIEINNPEPNISTDTYPPVIEFADVIQIIGLKYLLTVKVIDESGVSGFLLNSDYDPINYGCETLVSGSNKNGLFEMIIPDISKFSSFIVSDFYGNSFSAYTKELISKNKLQHPVYVRPPLQKVELDLKNVAFFINNIDVFNKPCYNTIYFNANVPSNYPLIFKLMDPVSSSYSIFGNIKDTFPVNWSRKLNLFYCDFIIPMNTITGNIPYAIISPHVKIYSSILTPLIVSKSKLDNDGPIISNIINLNQFGQVGWRVTITDQVNGFSNGYFKAIGSFDFSSYKYNFTVSDAILGNKINSTYDFILNIQTPCIAQDFLFEYIYLEDVGKRISKFAKHEKMVQTEVNPLRNLNVSLEFLKTTSICDPYVPINNQITQSTIQKSLEQLDVGGVNRTVKFIYSISTLGVVQMNQLPKLYLTSSTMKIMEYDLQLKFQIDYWFDYECTVEVPLGFGYPDSVLVSASGVMTNDGNTIGTSGFLNLIDTSVYSSTPILTGYEPFFLYSYADIIVYGRGFGSVFLIDVNFLNGTIIQYVPTVIGQTVLKIPMKDNDIKGPFEVSIQNTQPYTIKIIPVYFNKSESFQDIPTTPIPSNRPQECLGSPLCGGRLQGTCIENQGCVCFSPFVGKDCSSQIIIVPKPNINNTDPTVEIPVSGDEFSSFYKSLITIDSLREISLDNKPVKNFTFKSWIFKEIDSFSNRYISNITIDTTTVQITVTLKWFTNQTNIEFAGENFTMNPSSLKYTIEISEYPFESTLNSLQLVMSASFNSNNQNACSAKEYGETTAGDNSNYLKIQIENRSLYGRFIKRGIIKNKDTEEPTVVLLRNELLDSEMNPIVNPNQVQTYIGISIPWFGSSSIIDPDFSVLVDSNSASNSPNPTCSSESKLSGAKIAGIVKVEKKFIKKIDLKLKEIKE